VRRIRVVFEFDPHLFEADAQAYTHWDAVLDDLVVRIPFLTVSQRAAAAPSGHPW